MRAGISITDVKANVGPVGYYLAFPLVALVGWPAAALAPLAPALHALRVFGRLGSDIDRKWMVFFAGVVVLLPIGVGLALNSPLGDASPFAGIWGSLVAHYWRQWLGGIGAWLVWVLGASALTAATLAWNPIRALVGRVDGAPAPAAEPPQTKRSRAIPSNAAEAALALEPAPEEMPGLAELEESDAAGDVAVTSRKPRKRKPKAPTADQTTDQTSVLPANLTAAGLGDELPPTDLL